MDRMIDGAAQSDLVKERAKNKALEDAVAGQIAWQFRMVMAMIVVIFTCGCIAVGAVREMAHTQTVADDRAATDARTIASEHAAQVGAWSAATEAWGYAVSRDEDVERCERGYATAIANTRMQPSRSWENATPVPTSWNNTGVALYTTSVHSPPKVEFRNAGRVVAIAHKDPTTGLLVLDPTTP